jgi:hypothetical protein
MRFDNYDDIWDVKTRPNHFHVRGMQSVIESPIRGMPDLDIPTLFKHFQKKIEMS